MCSIYTSANPNKYKIVQASANGFIIQTRTEIRSGDGNIENMANIKNIAITRQKYLVFAKTKRNADECVRTFNRNSLMQHGPIIQDELMPPPINQNEPIPLYHAVIQQ